MIDEVPEHEHDLDDCKCCGQAEYCLICEYTSLELRLMKEMRLVTDRLQNATAMLLGVRR